MSVPSKYEGLWPIKRTGSSDNERKQVNNLFKMVLNDLSPSTSVDLSGLEERVVALENGDADVGDAVFNLGGVDTLEAGDVADRPAANEFGAWYFATDENKLYRDDGSSWNLELSLDHTDLENIGTNTHPQIDTHIASTSNPHEVTLEQARTQNQLMSGDFDLATISTPSTPSSNIARIFAFDQNGQTRVKYVNSDGLSTDLSQDNNFVVRNTTGSTLNRGQIVYVTSQTGVVPDVALALSDSATTMPSIGILAEDVVDNGFAKCIAVGLLDGIDTSAWSVNDLLYVSESTAGGLTNTRPAHPNLNQQVARVLVSDVGNGSIAVNVFDIDGESLGTQQNNYRVGDGTAGNKTLDFVGSSVSTITWDGTEITIPDLVITESQITDLGSYLVTTNNLSDLDSASTARTNLGLGTAAEVDTGTGSSNVPTVADMLAGNWTWTDTQIFRKDGSGTQRPARFQNLGTGNCFFTLQTANDQWDFGAIDGSRFQISLAGSGILGFRLNNGGGFRFGDEGNNAGLSMDADGSVHIGNSTGHSIGGHAFQYDVETVELGGDFNAGDSIKCVRIGDYVSITSVGVLTHTSATTAISSSGVIPSQFRPTDDTFNTYESQANLYQMNVFSDGSVSFQYSDHSGAGVSRSGTNTQASVTFNV